MNARLLVVVAAALAAAACQPPQNGPGGPGTSTATTTASAVNSSAPPPMTAKPQGETRQVNISDADRTQLEQLIRQYLDHSANANASGFVASGISDEIVSLQPGADYRWVVNLHGGTSYRILGACDNECSNIDMEVLDASGQTVGSDVLPDDIPIVNVQPTADTSFTVRLIMRTCTIAPCFVGARVLQQGGGKMGDKP